MGFIKSLALGDFTVNMGQGLTQWQRLAFKKGSDVTNIKRQLAVLRPYNSAGEVNFHRGFGITIAKNNVEATLFASYKRIDANFVADTLNNEDYISSLQTSCLHRTKSETDDKGVQQQLAFGGNIACNKNNWHLGVNAIRIILNCPSISSKAPINCMQFREKLTAIIALITATLLGTCIFLARLLSLVILIKLL